MKNLSSDLHVPLARSSHSVVMRSLPRSVVLITALALPLLAILVGLALSDGPRPPRVPAEVSVGSSPGPDPPLPSPSQHPSAQLPPPPPDDDDDDDDD